MDKPLLFSLLFLRKQVWKWKNVLKAKGLNVVHCPECAILGQTLYELVHNDRIIGTSSAKAQQKVKAIYQSFVEGGCF
ncbi:hypothetical protein [Colwellia sp. BRX10-3]|uniref:hypothetical protein n=1 Tax=Colwellia sp. BRX10-3 TaxID=2759844 RepID=UPI0021751B21|nr:hypothetical protein [Colwellia sp. BRX10-3]